MVIDRRGMPEALPILAGTVMRAALDVEPVTVAQVEIAREAWARYGEGSGHPAQLNFGDCFAYALATVDRSLLVRAEQASLTLPQPYPRFAGQPFRTTLQAPTLCTRTFT